jgi:hypothetical protein
MPPDTIVIVGQCRMVLSEGLATIDDGSGTFHLEWAVRNSCTGALLSAMREDGHFKHTADSLTFVVNRGGLANRDRLGGVDKWNGAG